MLFTDINASNRLLYVCLGQASQYALPGDRQTQPAKPGDPTAIVTGWSWHTMLCLQHYSCNSLGYITLQIQCSIATYVATCMLTIQLLVQLPAHVTV